MKNYAIQIILWLLMSTIAIQAYAQFPGPAGTLGTTAIHKDSNIIATWAANCIVQRGWMNIADTSLGKALVGDETYVPGPAASGIVSLGDGGVATLTFHYPLRNGPGFDFAVFENAFDDRFLELAFVEVSSDGKNFVRFAATSLTPTDTQVEAFDFWADATKINNLAGKYRANFGTPFDLEELKDSVGIDVNNITHVRIIDVVGSIDSAFARMDHFGNVINDPWPTPFASSGFDLDAVAVINHHGPPAFITKISVVKPLIYPIPAKDMLHIRSVYTIDQISIADMFGKQLLKTTQTSLDVSTLSEGIYQISILFQDGTYYKQLWVR
jgi:hypothetical protein